MANLVNNASGSMFIDYLTKAYYKLDNTTDSGPSGLTLTNSGTTTFIAGKFGNCAHFVRTSSQFLYVSNSGGIDGGEITISLWFKATNNPANGTYYCLACQSNNSTKVGYFIYYYTTGTTQYLWFVRNKLGVLSQGPTATYTLTAGSWFNVVLVYESGNVRGYVNGKLIAGPTAASGNGSGTFSTNMVIGCQDNVGSAHYANGDIDEVIYQARGWGNPEIYNYYTQYKGALGSASNY